MDLSFHIKFVSIWKQTHDLRKEDKLELSWAKLSLGLASGYVAYEVAS